LLAINPRAGVIAKPIPVAAPPDRGEGEPSRRGQGRSCSAPLI